MSLQQEPSIDEINKGDIARALAAYHLQPELVNALQLAYRKHWFEDDTIGWDELGTILLDALSNAMGPTALMRWQAQWLQEGD